MELVCRSYGGNPPAQLIWYKNNRQVVSQYTTSGRDSASTYRFKVQPGDNKARLRCEASNTISDKPLKKEIDLTVLCEFYCFYIFFALHFFVFHSTPPLLLVFPFIILCYIMFLEKNYVSSIKKTSKPFSFFQFCFEIKYTRAYTAVIDPIQNFL